MEQWYFRITAYADQLLDDLATLDWPEHIVAMQRNWIGRSEGVEFEHGDRRRAGESRDARVAVYTTRPDTVPGVTFVALAPEHPLVERITAAEQRAAVTEYREQAGPAQRRRPRSGATGQAAARAPSPAHTRSTR